MGRDATASCCDILRTSAEAPSSHKELADTIDEAGSFAGGEILGGDNSGGGGTMGDSGGTGGGDCKQTICGL